MRKRRKKKRKRKRRKKERIEGLVYLKDLMVLSNECVGLFTTVAILFVGCVMNGLLVNAKVEVGNHRTFLYGEGDVLIRIDKTLPGTLTRLTAVQLRAQSKVFRFLGWGCRTLVQITDHSSIVVADRETPHTFFQTLA